ncbi:MAG: hypothetical protein QNL93_06575, partial [Opitutae bacterium]
MMDLSRKFISIGCFVTYCILGLLFNSCGFEELKNKKHSEKSSLGNYRLDEYVGASTCAECHVEAHAKWEDSHHFHAMELPTPKT